MQTRLFSQGKGAFFSRNSSSFRSCKHLVIILFALWIFSTGVVSCATAADTLIGTNHAFSPPSENESTRTTNLTMTPGSAGLLPVPNSPYAPVEEDNADEINETAMAAAENEIYAYDLVDKGIRCYSYGDIACASQSFKSAYEILPDNVNIIYVQAQFLSFQKRYDEALKKIDAAIALDPDNAELWYQKGMILNNMGRFFESGSSFDRAEELEPGLVFPVTNRFPVNVILKNSTFIILTIGFCVLAYVFYIKEIRK